MNIGEIMLSSLKNKWYYFISPDDFFHFIYLCYEEMNSFGQIEFFTVKYYSKDELDENSAISFFTKIELRDLIKYQQLENVQVESFLNSILAKKLLEVPDGLY